MRTALNIAIAAVSAAVIAGASFAFFASSASAQTFPVQFHVGSSGGAPVVDDAWLAAQISRANEIFAPTEVAFRIAGRSALEGDANILTRRQRHHLGPHLHSQVINVFVVEALKDVDVEDRFIRGVHWRSHLVPGSHYVILSKIAGQSVLAHELGHFFGNPHSDVAGNVMSYQRGEGLPFFDRAQQRRIRRSSRRFRREELRVEPAQPSEQPN